MTPERYRRICDVLDKRQPDLAVITDKVHKSHNLAAIVRTCDAMGVPEMHSVRPDGGLPRHKGTALGSQKWVNVSLYDRVDDPIEQLQEQGFQVVAAHLSDSAVDFRDIDYTKPTAVLMGTEKYGVSEVAQEKVDQHIVIPMLGMVESFNVSVAAAIILSEAQRQRSLAGMFDKPRIDEETYKTLSFEWAQPVITEFCQRKGVEYPELDEDGDIVDMSAWYQGVKSLPDIK